MNIVTIFLAAAAAFVVGAVWYGVLFGKQWQRAAGMSDQDVQSGNMAPTMGLTFLFELAMATMLAHNFARLGQPPFHIKMMMATGIALAFVIPAMGVNYLYLRKTGAHFFLDAGHWLLAFAAMGLVFSFMG